MSPREPSPAAQRGRACRGPTTPRRARLRPPSRHLRRTLRCLSQPTQCQTLRSGQGDAAPPLNPQLPAPLPGQRAVGAAVAKRVAGAIPADRLSVTGAARAHARRSTPQRNAGVLRDRRGGAPRQPLCGYKGYAGLGPLRGHEPAVDRPRIGPQRIAPQRLGPASGSRRSRARYPAQSFISRRRRSNRSVRRYAASTLFWTT